MKKREMRTVRKNGEILYGSCSYWHPDLEQHVGEQVEVSEIQISPEVKVLRIFCCGAKLTCICDVVLDCSCF